MKKSVLALAVFGALVAVAAWFFLLYSPKSADLKKAKDKVSEAERKESSLRSELQELKILKEDEPRIDADLARVKSAVPDQPDLAAFIKAANDVAAESGIEWVSVNPAEPVPGGALSNIGLTIQVTGDFFNIVDYLGRLYEMSRAVTVDGIEFASTQEESGATTITASVTGRMFTAAGAAATTGLDIGALAGQGVTGLIGGGLLTAIAGAVKNATMKQA